LLLVGSIVQAQSYPARPIRLVVPYPPGGSTDLVARVIGQKMGDAWGQQVIIDNRPGASGMIGNELVARSAPDGYTIVMGTIGPFAVNQALFAKMPYDPIRDFAPVTLTGNVTNLLVVHPSIPAKNVKELIALARARPGQLTFGSSGTGGAPHLAGELFKIMAKVDAVHVPYKGGGPAMTDLMGGQLSFSFASMPSSLPFAKSGRLRALAVSSAKRSAAVPEIPTVAESGLPGFVVTDWQGVLAPARTPPEIVNKLNAEVIRILALPDVKEKLSTAGMELVTDTPQEFANYIRSESDKWTQVVKRAGVKVE
jgi:tripartite-type tricarboxylate transporter receptor subunit TctC